MSRTCHAVVVVLLLLTALPAGQSAGVGYMPWSAAQIAVAELREDLVPEVFRLSTSTRHESTWTEWASSRDQQIRARLARGDDDAVVNFLLYGTSFTDALRLTPGEVAALAEADRAIPDVLSVRIDDLADGVAAPGDNERLQFARRVVIRHGLNPDASDERDALRQFLTQQARRGPTETMDISNAIGTAFERADPDAVLMDLTAFRERGISSDTSILVNYAIEQALLVMKTDGLLTAEVIERVGIVGPGLDFTDKDGGFDFYPQQSIQPFAVIDALVGLGLARADQLTVTTFDVNPRITQHLEAARQRTAGGTPYRLVFPLDAGRPWHQPLIDYWARLGGQIGSEAGEVVAPPNAGEVQARAVDIRPDVVSSINSLDLNIIVQRLASPESPSFDLLIATDVLIYYDLFEQSLALANIAAMLGTGGIFLTNNAVFPLPGIPMAAAGQTTVSYMPIPGRGELNDQLVWYVKE